MKYIDFEDFRKNEKNRYKVDVDFIMDYADEMYEIDPELRKEYPSANAMIKAIKDGDADVELNILPSKLPEMKEYKKEYEQYWKWAYEDARDKYGIPEEEDIEWFDNDERIDDAEDADASTADDIDDACDKDFDDVKIEDDGKPYTVRVINMEPLMHNQYRFDNADDAYSAFEDFVNDEKDTVAIGVYVNGEYVEFGHINAGDHGVYDVLDMIYYGYKDWADLKLGKKVEDSCKKDAEADESATAEDAAPNFESWKKDNDYKIGSSFLIELGRDFFYDVKTGYKRYDDLETAHANHEVNIGELVKGTQYEDDYNAIAEEKYDDAFGGMKDSVKGDIIGDLIDDEYEAIDNYTEAINECDDQYTQDKLYHIRGEEVEHVEELEELKDVDKSVDDSCNDETHNQFAKPAGNKEEAYANALKYANEKNAPFIYGYVDNNDKFFALEQPIKWSEDAEKAFRQKYTRCKVIYTAKPKVATKDADPEIEEVIDRIVTEALKLNKENDNDPRFLEENLDDAAWVVLHDVADKDQELFLKFVDRYFIHKEATYDEIINDIMEDVVSDLLKVAKERLEDDEAEESVSDSTADARVADATYRGVPEIEFIWHGEYADPELIYKDKSFNYWSVEDALWEDFKEEMTGQDLDEDYFDGYVREHAKDLLDEWIAADEEFVKDSLRDPQADPDPNALSTIKTASVRWIKRLIEHYKGSNQICRGMIKKYKGQAKEVEAKIEFEKGKLEKIDNNLNKYLSDIQEDIKEEGEDSELVKSDRAEIERLTKSKENSSRKIEQLEKDLMVAKQEEEKNQKEINRYKHEIEVNYANINAAEAEIERRSQEYADNKEMIGDFKLANGESVKMDEPPARIGGYKLTYFRKPLEKEDYDYVMVLRRDGQGADLVKNKEGQEVPQKYNYIDLFVSFYKDGEKIYEAPAQI